MKQTNTLHFYIGDESKLVIDELFSDQEADDSLFMKMFGRILSEIDLVLPEICIDLYNDSLSDKESSSVLVERSINNIFGFIGDRGSGKSSSMMSVALSLMNCRNCRNKLSDKFRNISCRKFHVMETIDPSFFDNKINILDIVIGKLYSRFKNTSRGRQINTSFRNSLLDCFQTVRRCIANNTGDSAVLEDDDVESLEYLSSGVELQTAMQELINKYLKYNECEVLVIPIDDMDLHTECGYKMLEQIRKYLIQHNVIVLMALKLDQMERVIQLEVAKQYKPLIDLELAKEENLIERSSRYMSKLLPHSHRFYMPTNHDIIDSELCVWELKSEDNKTTKSIEGKNIEEKVHNGRKWVRVPEEMFPKGKVKDVVTQEIFVKTRYLFYNSNNKVSPIVPNNLRELRHLVGMLFDMPTDDSDLEHFEYNRAQFKEYFRLSWITLHLDEKGKDFFHTLESVAVVSSINKIVVGELVSRYKDYLSNIEKNSAQEELKYITDVDNKSYNVSIGDVFALIIYLKNLLTDEHDTNLIFAIETFYSIRLFEYYRLWTENYAQDQNALTYLDRNNLVRQSNLLDGVSNYHQLIGGCFINSKFFRLVTPHGQPKYQDEEGWNSVLKISIDIFDRLIDLYYSDTEVTETSLMSDSHNGFLIAMEVMSLLVSRKKYNSKDPDKYDATFRKNTEVVYYNQETSGSRNVLAYAPSQTLYFDLASLFFNITDIKLAYNKTNKRLYKIANSRSYSLLNNLRKITIEKYKIQPEQFNVEPEYNKDTGLYENKTTGAKYVKIQIGKNLEFYDVEKVRNRFVSWCAIRNAEILESFIMHLSIFGLGSDVGIYRYFDNVSKFLMKKYKDSDENGVHFDIEFDYISRLTEIFNTKYMEKFESFVRNRRNADLVFTSPKDITSLVEIIVKDGYSRRAINQRINETKSSILASLSRATIINKLEVKRREQGIRAWSGKTFKSAFESVIEEMKAEQ